MNQTQAATRSSISELDRLATAERKKLDDAATVFERAWILAERPATLETANEVTEAAEKHGKLIARLLREHALETWKNRHQPPKAAPTA